MAGQSDARPTFASGRDFALWALNAPDALVGIDLKLRAMHALLAWEAKQPPAPSQAPARPALPDLYAPRKVRGFGVVDGGGSDGTG